MAKRIVSIVLFASIAAAQDAATALAKAHDAFVQNRERDRYWTWTAVATRSVIAKDGQVLETIPSVTTESPIRSDGKRCTAVLAWGDGVEPYLANASADERCAVEKEVRQTFTLEKFLESKRVRVESNSGSVITLAIREDKAAMQSDDVIQHCVASIRGTVQVDKATNFPVMMEVHVPGNECGLKHGTAVNHYDDEKLKNVTSGFTKGTTLRYEYELQRDKNGNAAKDFWICAHSHTVRPFVKGSNALLISGRKFPLADFAGERNMVVDVKTTATELSSDFLIKFETEKDK
jgi:hypothetical protein